MMRIAALCCLLAMVATVQAAEVSLAWDQSISPNIVFNRVYFGNASHAYGTPITIPAGTNYTVLGLGPGVWYFAVTAVDLDGNESDFSNEVSQTIGTGVFVPRPMQNLTIQGVSP